MPPSGTSSVRMWNSDSVTRVGVPRPQLIEGAMPKRLLLGPLRPATSAPKSMRFRRKAPFSPKLRFQSIVSRWYLSLPRPTEPRKKFSCFGALV